MSLLRLHLQSTTNMSRLSNILAALAATVFVVSCGPKAVIDGNVEALASSDLVVKLLDVNKYKVLDTVAVDAAGKFTYKVEMEKGQPEFVYLFHGDAKVASLLLEAGDRVTVEADTLGNVVVTGSDESVKLAEIEKAHAEVLEAFAALQDDSQALAQIYIQYYRNRVKYVVENSTSLTVVPVLYQSLYDLPLFSQQTDAIIFSNTADSLEMVYPESKYVKALRSEAERRYAYFEFQTKLSNAESIGYPEIELPDLNARNVKLSDMDSKVVMIYFWTAANAAQNTFNVDVLKPLYEEYHSRGFDIYQVSFDVDKALWASAVKGQELPWTNVCDSRGVSSPYISTYNIPALPVAFILADGELVDGQIVDEKSLRNLLDKLLK